MATFKLEMFTPQKQFFSDEAEAVTVTAADGELSVLKGHQPMIVALPPGEVKIKLTNGEWKNAFVSDGFMEVRLEDVIIFSHFAEWPEDVDEAKAKRLLEQEKEQLKNAQSINEYRQTEIELQRMMMTLRNRGKSFNLNLGS